MKSLVVAEQTYQPRRSVFIYLLAGYATGGCVRVKCDRWKFVSMSPEERITSQEEQKRGAMLVLS
ncbi:MAG: hypothetical protein OSA98_05035 [Rubripirellula sp.]|nr:hypothetical protein [Rubripirellula sp.]